MARIGRAGYQGVSLETGNFTVEFKEITFDGGVKEENTKGSSDCLVRYQVVGFGSPP